MVHNGYLHDVQLLKHSSSLNAALDRYLLPLLHPILRSLQRFLEAGDLLLRLLDIFLQGPCLQAQLVRPAACL